MLPRIGMSPIHDDPREPAIAANIPDRSKPIVHDHVLYKERNRIKPMFGHFKNNRAAATRHNQLADSFFNAILIAATRCLFKFFHVT